MKSLKECVVEGLLDKEDKVFDIEKEGIIKKFLEENYVIDSYEIKTSNNGFVVDVKGRVIVKNKYITSLTTGLFEFGEVRQDFNCSGCDSLTSLEGAPKKCGGFYCNDCNSLTSLKGAPKKVEWSFYCSGCNSLTSLEGAPKEVGWDFNCSDCKSLKSLKGAPKKVDARFACIGCKSLKSLEGAPKKVGEDFDCRRCSVKFEKEDVKKYTNAKKIIV